MYLIRAEANCYLPGGETTAANDIKALQARALGKQPSEINLVYSSVEDLLKLVEKERIKELCFEGHRLFDITRKKQNMVRESSTNSIVKIKTYPMIGLCYLYLWMRLRPIPRYSLIRELIID